MQMFVCRWSTVLNTFLIALSHTLQKVKSPALQTEEELDTHHILCSCRGKQRGAGRRQLVSCSLQELLNSRKHAWIQLIMAKDSKTVWNQQLAQIYKSVVKT